MYDFSGKTVLVTGATGLIGSNLVDRFMSMGDVKVFALGRNKEKLVNRFKEYKGSKRFKIVIQNICEQIMLTTDTKINYIFHAAGAMTRDVIHNKPLEVIDANLIGTRNCLEFLKKQKEAGHDGRLVLFSSVTVYGNNTNNDKTVTENETNVAGVLDVPYAAYAETKRMSEVLSLAYYRQYDIDCVIARLSTVYGYVQFPPNTAFYEFIKKALSKEDIILRNSSSPKRDNIYIDDAINGLLLICEKGHKGEAYNISSNGDLENYAAVDEIAEIIAEEAKKLYGNEIEVKYASPISGFRETGIKLDNKKIKALGFKINYSLKKGIDIVLSKYKT